MKKILKILIFIFVALLCVTAEGKAQTSAVRKGNQFYEDGNFAASEKKYKQALEREPESEIINFNLGTALYKQKDFENTIRHFQKALLSEQEDLKQKVYYNLGNTFYQAGIQQEDNKIHNAIAFLENSLKQYEQAFDINREDEDTQYNYEYVKKELERLKEKQKQQQKQESQDNSQSDEQQKSKEQQMQDHPQRSDSDQEKEQQSEQDEHNQQENQQADQGDNDQSEQQYSGNQEKQQKQSSDSVLQVQQQTGQSPDAQPTHGAQVMNADALTEKEAEMLVEYYLQTEEPRGFLYMNGPRQDWSPVLKDW